MEVATALIESIVFAGEKAWDDEAIGKTLLGARLAAEGAARGIAAHLIPAKLVERWIDQIAQQETAPVECKPLEIALRLAARGDFSTAGVAFRNFMIDGVLHDWKAAFAADINRNKKQSDGGSKGAKAAVRPRRLPANISDELKKLIQAGRSPKEARGILKKRYGVSSEAVRKALLAKP